MPEVESKYQLEPTSESEWLITAPDRKPTWFGVKNDRWYVTLWESEGEGYDAQPYLPIYAFYPLVTAIAANLMTDWKPKEFKPGFYAERWAAKQTGKTINGRVHAIWQQRVNAIPQHKRDILKAVFATTLQQPERLQSEALWNEPYIQQDLRQYRAARIALIEVSSSLSQFYIPGTGTNAWNRERDLAREDREFVEAMLNWRGFYSDSGKPYRALNSTLDALPGNMVNVTLLSLKDTHLERPITDRAELICFLCCIGRGNYSRPLWHTFMYASRRDILRAMKVVAEYLDQPLSSRRSSDLMTFTHFVTDYRGQHDGGIAALTEKSIAMHREIDRERRQRAREWEAEREIELALLREDTTAVALPPIPLPDDARIQFLSTVGAIHAEGQLMGHCIASYAQDALNGLCYLFHVDYKGEIASVEVGRRGKVVQSYGADNESNSTSKWAREQLNKWGKNFPTTTALVPPEAPPLFDWMEANAQVDVQYAEIEF